MEAAAGLGYDFARALYAAGEALRDQIQRGEVAAVEPDEFQAHCGRVLEVHVALIDLAWICKRGSESSWPSLDRAANADAWQSAYEKLAIRISDGRVDITRPLKPLARLTARRFLLSEYRRQQRFLALNEIQLHRFNLGEATAPEEQVEIIRKRDLVRSGLTRLQAEEKLSKTDLAVLDGRYVKEKSSAEVASALGVSSQSVRQICSRRCTLLRAELGGLGLEEEAASEL